MEGKRELRRSMLAARDSLSMDQRREFSLAIRDRFFRLPMVEAANTLMLFLAFGSEVDTWLILDEAVALGKLVVAPVCLPATKGLVLYSIKSRAEAQPGHWGICEPRQLGEPMSPNTLDVVVVPGIAFDSAGNRLGYGGGYYDRFLLDIPRAWKIGVCYDMQLVDSLPRASHDIPVDVIITERQYLGLRK